MKFSLRLAAASTTILTAIPSFAAKGPAFLPPQQAVAILADGRPWSADAPDGAALKITFKKDGTGSVSGPMPFSVSLAWTVKGDAMCISGKMPTKCLRFSEVPGGLQSWDGDKPDLKFSR
jgi:hypothetical protein